MYTGDRGKGDLHSGRVEQIYLSPRQPHPCPPGPGESSTKNKMEVAIPCPVAETPDPLFCTRDMLNTVRSWSQAQDAGNHWYSPI